MTRLAFPTGWSLRCLRFTIAFWLKRRHRQWRQPHRLCGKYHIQETEAAEKFSAVFLLRTALSDCIQAKKEPVSRDRYSILTPVVFALIVKHMSKVRVSAFSVSLDGYAAGVRQSLENPL